MSNHLPPGVFEINANRFKDLESKLTNRFIIETTIGDELNMKERDASWSNYLNPLKRKKKSIHEYLFNTKRVIYEPSNALDFHSVFIVHSLYRGNNDDNHAYYEIKIPRGHLNNPKYMFAINSMSREWPVYDSRINYPTILSPWTFPMVGGNGHVNNNNNNSLLPLGVHQIPKSEYDEIRDHNEKDELSLIKNNVLNTFRVEYRADSKYWEYYALFSVNNGNYGNNNNKDNNIYYEIKVPRGHLYNDERYIIAVNSMNRVWPHDNNNIIQPINPVVPEYLLPPLPPATNPWQEPSAPHMPMPKSPKHRAKSPKRHPVQLPPSQPQIYMNNSLLHNFDEMKISSSSAANKKNKNIYQSKAEFPYYKELIDKFKVNNAKLTVLQLKSVLTFLDFELDMDKQKQLKSWYVEQLERHLKKLKLF
jgi:hypothetical protein